MERKYIVLHGSADNYLGAMNNLQTVVDGYVKLTLDAGDSLIMVGGASFVQDDERRWHAFQAVGVIVREE